MPLWAELIITYPFTRHLQRYEYVSRRGWVIGKTVLDVGCGNGQGSYILAITAKEVLGIDPILAPYMNAEKPIPFLVQAVHTCNYKGVVTLAALNVMNVNSKSNVAVCIEVFEHQPEVSQFVTKLAEICDYLFITTPLAATTGKTRNMDHIAEYSTEDFTAALSKHFDILELVYQTGDMRIQNYGTYTGDSFDEWHTVQMVWCRNKKI